MNNKPFSLEDDIGDILEKKISPIWKNYVETIIFCPHCKKEVNRHYPCLKGTFDVRAMIMAVENGPCPICGQIMKRTDGFTYRQEEVTPADKNFAICRSCGYIFRQIKGSAAINDKEWKCVTCAQIEKLHNTPDWEEQEWQISWDTLQPPIERP